MPRSRLAGPAPSRTEASDPDYFDSLEALAEYSKSKRPRHPNRSQVPLQLRGKRDDNARKLTVCHDYKGGYSESDLERGYTFQFWHLCDTYIYFSHHRVSLPPPAVIRTAHRHGTRVFGTLIFEWDAGRADIIELVSRGETEETVRFDVLDFRYADQLVDLAVERGFEGWLVNVEVELGGRKNAEGDREGAKQHVKLLLAWLKYFKEEMHKRVPGGEVMWYDAVTKEGKLQWQNTLNDLNYPFLSVCDSLFLNYFWGPPQISSTLSFLSTHPSLQPTQIHFGIDVFGRGSYGGGGFETYRAFEAIHESNSSLSVALFAPGWTVESSDLKHSLESKESYGNWFKDEMYLWSNGPSTPSVPKELARMRNLRRDQAGTFRARKLADALRRDPRIPLTKRAAIQPLEFDLEKISNPPGTFRSISSFVSSPRPPPPSSVDGGFYTNFSAGSGHSFFVEGRERERSETGWTDVDHTFPFPSLLFQKPATGVKASFTEEAGEVWQGERSIRIDFDGEKEEEEVTIEVLALDFSLVGGDYRSYNAEMVYKFLHNASGDNPKVSPMVRLFTSNDRQLKHDDTSDRLVEGASHWRTTRITFRSDESTRITKLSISIPRRSSFLIGSLSIYPAQTSVGPRLEIIDLTYSESTAVLEWSTSLRFPTTTSSQLTQRADSSPSLNIPRFIQYHIYRRRGSKEKGGKELAERKGEGEEYLGTTREKRFEIAKDVISGYLVIVRGVEASGAVAEAYLEIE
ncbi:uncharacterized protein JCM6883_007612 [Sporobolomyces salmoneus]|uniref:uncharacterized protein n=1 Tax=Sporobolomyces salmoneus TaxID=183962 RepID=UPI00316E5065